ncbi:MAG: CCA tRNA nucleotidyltransferase [Elusimicrobiota bacterium]
MFPLAALRPLSAPAFAGRCWLVGGALRDAALGRPLRDVDVAVDGDPLAAARLVAAPLKAKPFPLDEERGVYRVAVKGAAGAGVFDFSKLQGRTLAEDLRRRDFTVNAMALALEDAPGGFPARVVDPFDGRKDLKARKIRLTSEKVLREDPLRVLRAFRFASELGFRLEAGTLRAVSKHAGQTARSAPERIRDELYKILSAPRAAHAFREMDRAGLLPVLFPECADMRRTARAYYGKEGVLGHSLAALASFEELLEQWRFYFPKFHGKIEAYLAEPVAGYPRYALLKLAEFLHDVGKPATAKVEDGKLHFHGHEVVGMRQAEAIAARLRLSREETRALGRLVRAHMRPGNLGHQPVVTDRAVYRFYRDLEDDAVGMLLVALGDHFTYLSEREKRSRKDPVFATIYKLLAAHFLKPDTVRPPRVVDGRDLMKRLGLKPGPLVGRLLESIQEAQAAGAVAGKEQALKWAERRLKEEPAAPSAAPQPTAKRGRPTP